MDYLKMWMRNAAREVRNYVVVHARLVLVLRYLSNAHTARKTRRLRSAWSFVVFLVVGFLLVTTEYLFGKLLVLLSLAIWVVSVMSSK